jgi:predicted RND superfamily exporter protein
LLRQNKTESEDVLTMKAKLFVTVAVAALLVAGTFAIAQAPAQPKPAPSDTRIDKLLEQNEQILKNQQDILKQLGDLKESILILKRRSS